MHNDTIAAIATPPGIGGIGIIRVSGPQAFTALLPLLRQASGRTHLPPTHLLTYGHIFDPATQEILDEVLVAFMHAPHTYTCEDIVEIQGHGSPLVLQRILHLVLAHGVRIATPGEFTLRAFLNGRLDLAQAEAVMDLISAQTETALRIAMQQFGGRISAQVQDARHNLLGILARIEASIDFPEEDVPTPHPQTLHQFIALVQQQIDTLLATAQQGRLYRHGLRTAIIGRPNVGKSSLLNVLLHSERAIVTSVAGTTRDTVEEVTNLRGIPLHLIDTAGITPTDNPIEHIGVQRSRAAAESADLLLLVFDGSEPLTEQDRRISKEVSAMGFSPGTTLAHKPLIVVVNKADCLQQLDLNEVRNIWSTAPLVVISTLTGAGLVQLEEAIAALFLASKTPPRESLFITSVRHQQALRCATEHLQASQATLEQNLPLDFVSIDLHAAYDSLGEIIGETVSEDLLDRIFSDFCIGK